MISTRFIALLALAASLPFSESQLPDGWTLSITHPKADTIWYAGSIEAVKWDAKYPSIRHANPTGDIYLASNGTTLYQYHLASRFNISAGEVDITVPDVSTGEYYVVLTSAYGPVGSSVNFTIIDK